MKNTLKAIACIVISQFICSPALSANNQTDLPDWNTWLKEFKDDAQLEGIEPRTIEKVMQTIKPSKKVLKLDKTQSKRRASFKKYYSKKVDNYTIKKGQRLIRKHQRLLNQIENEYQVNKCLIVSLWGMESAYGYYKGRFPVIQALSTLAYDPRRGDFFRKELMYALKMVDQKHISLKDFKGEWAGGSGHPQFLPSTWHHYAVDHNKDGKKDIWNTLPDVFASIANFMHQNGWKDYEPWGVEVTFPKGLSENIRGLENEKKRSVSSWRRLGVGIEHNPRYDDLEGWVISLQDGPTLLVFDNYKVFRKWNRSMFYGATLGSLSEKMCS